MPPRIDVGQVIAERYELARPLGRGSMGEVWVAHHRTLDEDVALKLLTRAPAPAEIEDPSTALARFRFEAQVAARLSRKTRHIVRVTDNGEEDGLPYLVMELLEGETLASRLLRTGPFDPSLTSRLVAQIARALTEAHAAGVIHRDLKPANVFLTRDEDGGMLVKVLDFGIARTMQTHRVTPPFSTAPGLIFGTPGYMSPEQAFLSAEVDHRCDLWALGTIAYEALTNELPLAGAHTQELLANLCAGRIVSIHERNPGLPGPLEGFFARVFAADIAARFASASELSQAFDEASGPSAGSPVDRPAAAPDLVKGNTLSITLPLRSRRPHDEASRSLRAPGRPRSRAFVLAAALLVGVAALGTAWRALALRAPRPTVATAPSMVEPLGAVDEPTSPILPEQPTMPPDPVTTTAPPPEATERVPAAPPTILPKRATQPVTVLPTHTAPLPSAPSSTAQGSSSPVPGPAVPPSPRPSSSARAPEDPSGIL